MKSPIHMELEKLNNEVIQFELLELTNFNKNQTIKKPSLVSFNKNK